MMDERIYRSKVMGAWLGKAVGGTLGQPWEGARGPLALDFYDPVPTEMMPNDDLDLQILWACKLATDWQGVISCRNFESAWLESIHFPFDEYGVAIRNLKLGIHAPASGRYDNWFVDGLGAAIRSEIWACLAPGDPALAVRYAACDGCVDHDGNGLYAEEFLAALESLAFVESDIPTLIEKALALIPAESELAHAISDTVAWCREGADFNELRNRIMARYGSANFTDVKMNLAFETAALLLGNGDFGRSICLAVNFGQDADCTGATVGAILGIRDPESIPEQWLRPIGRNLLLSKEITGVKCPDSIDAFTDLVIGLRGRVRQEDIPAAEYDAARVAIPMRQSDFAPWFAADYRKFKPVSGAEFKPVSAPGNLMTVDFSDRPRESLRMLEADFVLEQGGCFRVLVNTTALMQVWLDGQFLFGREGGAMVPAFHRALANQLAACELDAGKHTLTIGLAPANEAMTSAPLLFGIAGTDNQWLVDPFRKNGLAK